MGIRTVNDPYGNPAVLIDYSLKDAYEVVRSVAYNIDFVKKVSRLFDEDGTVVANLHKRYIAVNGQSDFILPVGIDNTNGITVFVNNILKSPMAYFLASGNTLSFREPLNSGDIVDVMIISGEAFELLEEIHAEVQSMHQDIEGIHAEVQDVNTNVQNIHTDIQSFNTIIQEVYQRFSNTRNEISQIISSSHIFFDISQALANTTDGNFFWVISDNDTEAYSLYFKSAGTAQFVTSVLSSDFALSLVGPDKNLFDKAKMVRAGFYYSSQSNAIIASTEYRCSKFIKLTEGEFYAISGVKPGMLASFANTESDSADFTGSATLTDGTAIVRVPVGHPYLVVNITDSSADGTTYDDTLQVEYGDQVSEYEAYRFVIANDRLPTSFSSMFTNLSKNLIDLRKINYNGSYSTNERRLVVGASTTPCTDWIAVQEGVTYVISEESGGGYFTNYGDTVAHSNIDFRTIFGLLNQKTFRVPTGQGITHVVINIQKDPDSQAPRYNPQLEVGSGSTTWKAYDPNQYIRPDLILKDSLFIFRGAPNVGDNYGINFLISQNSDPRFGNIVSGYVTGIPQPSVNGSRVAHGGNFVNRANDANGYGVRFVYNQDTYQITAYITGIQLPVTRINDDIVSSTNFVNSNDTASTYGVTFNQSGGMVTASVPRSPSTSVLVNDSTIGNPNFKSASNHLALGYGVRFYNTSDNDITAYITGIPTAPIGVGGSITPSVGINSVVVSNPDFMTSATIVGSSLGIDYIVNDNIIKPYIPWSSFRQALGSALPLWVGSDGSPAYMTITTGDPDNDMYKINFSYFSGVIKVNSLSTQPIISFNDSSNNPIGYGVRFRHSEGVVTAYVTGISAGSPVAVNGTVVATPDFKNSVNGVAGYGVQFTVSGGTITGYVTGIPTSSVAVKGTTVVNPDFGASGNAIGAIVGIDYIINGNSVKPYIPWSNFTTALAEANEGYWINSPVVVDTTVNNTGTSVLDSGIYQWDSSDNYILMSARNNIGGGVNYQARIDVSSGQLEVRSMPFGGAWTEWTNGIDSRISEVIGYNPDSETLTSFAFDGVTLPSRVQINCSEAFHTLAINIYTPGNYNNEDVLALMGRTITATDEAGVVLGTLVLDGDRSQTGPHIRIEITLSDVNDYIWLWNNRNILFTGELTFESSRVNDYFSFVANGFVKERWTFTHTVDYDFALRQPVLDAVQRVSSISVNNKQIINPDFASKPGLQIGASGTGNISVYHTVSGNVIRSYVDEEPIANLTYSYGQEGAVSIIGSTIGTPNLPADSAFFLDGLSVTVTEINFVKNVNNTVTVQLTTSAAAFSTEDIALLNSRSIYITAFSGFSFLEVAVLSGGSFGVGQVISRTFGVIRGNIDNIYTYRTSIGTIVNASNTSDLFDIDFSALNENYVNYIPHDFIFAPLPHNSIVGIAEERIDAIIGDHSGPSVDILSFAFDDIRAPDSISVNLYGSGTLVISFGVTGGYSNNDWIKVAERLIHVSDPDGNHLGVISLQGPTPQNGPTFFIENIGFSNSYNWLYNNRDVLFTDVITSSDLPNFSFTATGLVRERWKSVLTLDSSFVFKDPVAESIKTLVGPTINDLTPAIVRSVVRPSLLNLKRTSDSLSIGATGSGTRIKFTEHTKNGSLINLVYDDTNHRILNLTDYSIVLDINCQFSFRSENPLTDVSFWIQKNNSGATTTNRIAQTSISQTIAAGATTGTKGGILHLNVLEYSMESGEFINFFAYSNSNTGSSIILKASDADNDNANWIRIREYPIR